MESEKTTRNMKNSEQGPPLPSHHTFNQLWMVPYARNPYFIGRETELQEIATFLGAGQNGASGLAVSGAGGTGKTHLVLEYAYRHREEYSYVFWVLAETHDTLNAAYEDIAQLLDLPEKGRQEQCVLVEAVKNWLANHHTWLLILDHASDLALTRSYLPDVFSGHLLFTTRASATGKLARRIKLKALVSEEGRRLLLRRCALLHESNDLAEEDSEADKAARAIADELDGLPLALNLAGAYIVETSCSLRGYLERLRRQPAGALGAGDKGENRPGPTTKAVHVTCEKVARAGSAAAAFLHLCSFLAPDEIPEALLRAGSPVLSKPLQKLAGSPAKLSTMLASLQTYALLERDPEIQTLAMHREVQRALRDMLPIDEERACVEQMVRVLGLIFPRLEINDWEACQRLLPHAQICAEQIDFWNLERIEGAWLLHHAGWYLHTRAEYARAQVYEEKALAIYRAVLGDEHPSTAMILNNLAITYEDRGKLKDAAALHQQALAIRRGTLGENHADTAASLHNLALISHTQGKLDDAASLHRQALAIRHHLLGEEHPETATSLHNLAMVCHDQGKLDEAIALHQRALNVRRRVLGSKHPETIVVLNGLAAAHQARGEFGEAIDWLRRALAAQLKAPGRGQPDLTATFSALASVYQVQGKLDDASFWLQQALAAQRGALGQEQPGLARVLETLAIAYEEGGQNDKAEALYRQALVIYQAGGDGHPDEARCSYNLALLYLDQKRAGEARTLLEQALSIWQSHHGPDHPDARKAREKYEQLAQKLQSRRKKQEQHEQQTEKQNRGDSAGLKRILQRVGRGRNTGGLS